MVYRSTCKARKKMYVTSKGMTSPEIIWLGSSIDETPVNSQSNNKKKLARSPKRMITKVDGSSSKIQLISGSKPVEKVDKTSLVEKNSRKTIYTLERGYFELCNCGQASCYGCHWSSTYTSESLVRSSIKDVAPRSVKWSEYREINKATLSVNQHRAAKGEYFCHPLLYNTDQFTSRNSIAQKTILTYTEGCLKERELLIRKLPSSSYSGISLQESLHRFLTIESIFGASTHSVSRTLINRDLSQGKELFPVFVYSDVTNDNEGPSPAHFEYVTENLYPNWFTQWNELTYACNCLDDCQDDCTCRTADQALNPDCSFDPYSRSFEYTGTKSSHIKDEFYENVRVLCGSMCSCPPSCAYKHPIKSSNKMEIFKKNKDIGYGVRVMNSISAGEVISEFTGEVLIDRTLDDISKENLNHIEDYAYDLSSPSFEASNPEFGCHLRRCAAVFPDMKKLIHNYKPKQAYIFPFYKGNSSRFATHGCMPNVSVIRVISNDVRPEAYKLYLVSLTDIPAGSELFLDYGDKYKGMSECLCGTTLCSNTNNLKYLARLTKDCSPEDVLNIVKQRLSNQSSLSILQSLLFQKWELSRASGQPDPETVSLTMNTRMIAKQVETIVRYLEKNIPISVNHLSLELLADSEVNKSIIVQKRNLSVLLSPSNMELLDENIQKYEHFMNRESCCPSYKPTLLKELMGRLIYGYSRQNASPDKNIEVITIDNEPASTNIGLTIQKKSASPGHNKRVFGSSLQNLSTKVHTGTTNVLEFTTPGLFQDKLKGFRIPKKRRVPPDTPVVKSKQ